MSRAAIAIIWMISVVVAFQTLAAGGQLDSDLASDAPRIVAVPVHETAVVAPVSRRPRIEIVASTAEKHARVDEAVDRFVGRGLALPDLDIAFFDDPASCDGALGRFQPLHTPWRIRVCSDLDFVVTHELAHAWEKANLSDEQRTAHLEYRGLEAWNDPDVDWNQRGAEDAAFVIQQMLMVENPPETTTWRDRSEAFERLTGRQPEPRHA